MSRTVAGDGHTAGSEPAEPGTPDFAGGEKVSVRGILRFFVPLGLAASLVSLSHVIVNSTLARAPDPESTIAAYTIAMSIFTITERPAVFLRQTCSALAADRTGFRSVAVVMVYVMLFTLGFGSLLSYTPLGPLVLSSLFNAGEQLLGGTIAGYRIMFLVTVFSAIRCLFQGIIIRNMQTKWLTIGMIVRLLAMYGLSLAYLRFGWTIDGRTGAFVFLGGMFVEAAVAAWEGRRIYRQMPERLADAPVRRARDVFPFYRPLIITSFIAVMLAPSINVMLGKTVNIELAIASYSVALSVQNLVNSFFTYTHQIVLNFYRRDAAAVRRFVLGASLLPAAVIALLAWTPAGKAALGAIVGAEGQLLDASIETLRVFLLFALVFPWVDYFNGLAMLNKKTRFMMGSQAGNLAATVTALIVLTAAVPGWNGKVGALAQSCGIAVELAVLAGLMRWWRRRRIIRADVPA
jgi:Na+-driven multidrug efflux pump